LVLVWPLMPEGICLTLPPDFRKASMCSARLMRLSITGSFFGLVAIALPVVISCKKFAIIHENAAQRKPGSWSTGVRGNGATEIPALRGWGGRRSGDVATTLARVEIRVQILGKLAEQIVD